MSLVKNVDIINNPAFQVSQKIFVAVAKDIKRDGKGAIAHYPPIEENDLTKMYEYFDNTSDNVKLQQNVFVDIMLYFGRQRREKIHELKSYRFSCYYRLRRKSVFIFEERRTDENSPG
jgi:hypothetical protein